MAVALTSLSHGAGCGCKIAAADLRPIVAGLPRPTDPRVIVGSDTLGGRGRVPALATTSRWSRPSTSSRRSSTTRTRSGASPPPTRCRDVYAMGGVPMTCLNLVAYPLEALGADVLEAILRGGADAAEAAGASVIGGHSIDDPEPKYGMAVTGTVHPDRILSNGGGRAGDVLVLTKPLGAGAVATAVKRGLADDALVTRAIEVMTTLNADAARAGARGRRPLRDRRHRLRPAQPPQRAGAGQRRRGRGGRGGRPRDRGRRSSCWPTTAPWPAARAATAPSPRPSTRPSRTASPSRCAAWSPTR